MSWDENGMNMLKAPSFDFCCAHKIESNHGSTTCTNEHPEGVQFSGEALIRNAKSTQLKTPKHFKVSKKMYFLHNFGHVLILNPSTHTSAQALVVAYNWIRGVY